MGIYIKLLASPSDRRAAQNVNSPLGHISKHPMRSLSGDSSNTTTENFLFYKCSVSKEKSHK